MESKPTAAEVPPAGLPVHVYVVDCIGFALTGLGIYGKFADGQQALFPFFADPVVTLACLGAGVALMGYAAFRFFTHFRRLQRTAPLSGER